MTATLWLKWGTYKGYDGLEKGHPARAALQAYFDAGEQSMSAALHSDSDEQKAALCAAIDAFDQIYNEWSGEHMTKDAAKEYVLNYGKKS